MRILVVTQKVDSADPLLGFFHRWLEEFARRFPLVTTICLEKGMYELPPNVNVLSLGKELRQSRTQYVFRFYRYIVRERKNYDVVFVHMNPEYMVLGGLLWRLWGKRLLMWYNHPQGNIWIRIAALFAHKVLHTSPFAFARRFDHALQMPAGIDADIFRRDPKLSHTPNSVLTLGRIAEIKHIHVMIDAARRLYEEKVPFTFTLYGDPGPKDASYNNRVRREAADLESAGKVLFKAPVPNSKTPSIYNLYEVFVNATPTGSFDKAILEAMACETVVVVSNRSFEGIVPPELLFTDGDAKSLVVSLKAALAMPDEAREQLGTKLRDYVVSEHSLQSLINKLQLLFARETQI